jgi:PhnB protein
MASDAIVKVQPYVFFDGRCEEAIEFYKKTLGAEVTFMMRFKDNPEGEAHYTPGTGEKIMHAFFSLGGTGIMASDGLAKGNPKFEGISLSISAKNVAEAERLFAALSDGGKVTQPLIEAFFSPRFGMVTDRFGLGWMVVVEQEQK